MDNLVKHLKLVLILLFVASFTLCGCSGRENITESSFVGKWKSSRSETPVYLYANGKWEVKLDDGVLFCKTGYSEYWKDPNNICNTGYWKYQDNNITWWTPIQSDKQTLQDVNPVLSLSPTEFKVRENDGTITTFKKL